MKNNTLLEKIKEMSVDELKNLSDEELIEVTELANGNTKDIKKILHVNFSYSALTQEITKRGGRSGWYYPAKYETKRSTPEAFNNDGISIDLAPYKTGQSTKQTISLKKRTYEKWKKIVTDFPDRDTAQTLVFELFMDLYNEGKLKFTFKKVQ